MWVWVGGAFIAATLERWWFPSAWDETGLPASRFYFGDTRAFVGYAAALSAGAPFDNGVPFHPPGWPLVLSLLFRAFGWSADAPPDPLLLKHVSAIVSGASVALAAWLGYFLGGRVVMIVTSLLGVFHFGHMVQAAAPNSEPLYGLLMVLVIGLTVQQRIPSALVGLLAGFTALVRAEFVLCAALLAVWIAFFNRTAPRGYRRAAHFAFGAILALAPTTILHWRSIDEFNRTRASSMPGPLPRFAPITGYGAFAFANANHARAEGGFAWDLMLPESSDAEAAAILEEGQLDLSRPATYRAYVDGYRLGATWLVTNPVSALALLWKKAAITLSVFDFGYLLDNVPVKVEGVRRPVDQLDLATSWLTIVHAALFVAGCWIAARHQVQRVLLFPVVTLCASALLFFGYVRLGVAYLPVLWIVQALAATRLLALLPVSSTWVRRTEIAAGAILALLLLTDYSRASQRRALLIDGLVDEAGRLVEDQKIEMTRVK